MTELRLDPIVALILELTPVPGLSAAEVEASDQLLTGGFIDSLGLLQIVEAIERTQGARVPPEHITVDNFNSLAAIGRLMAKLTTRG